MNELRTLLRMCGLTKKERLRNAYVRGPKKVASVADKLDERRLQWDGHVQRRNENDIVKRAMEVKVESTMHLYIFIHICLFICSYKYTSILYVCAAGRT